MRLVRNKAERVKHQVLPGVSNEETLSVPDLLQPPTISFTQRSAVFLKGQTVTIRCEAPEEFEDCKFTLYRETELGVLETAVAGYAATFNLTDVGKGDEGTYFCAYQAFSSNRLWVNSSASNRVNVTVHDDVELRLVQKGGIGGVVVVSDCEGTAEVRYNGTWGMACGDSWNMAVAQVACRHLGCGFVRTFQRVERSSAVREQAQLTHVHCLGTEQLLWKCQSLSWGDGACYSGFRVDIACSGKTAPPPPVQRPGEQGAP
ncbi:scavenger receptor cysteine-rich type 1 protein M160-like [Rhincodon typus]|uniref:scavenger receptor cysteine-rich type 1 protein M160-like n=1 Tax=Rhincodon typus TaxID=259920 RepID=UPI00202FAFC3|nr:scavenger receptor cysteine-rich type 1 protein M160-like [Rhincodon typus]